MSSALPIAPESRPNATTTATVITARMTPYSAIVCPARGRSVRKVNDEIGEGHLPHSPAFPRRAARLGLESLPSDVSVSLDPDHSPGPLVICRRARPGTLHDAMTKSGSQKSKSPSQLIDARIRELGDWRGEMLGRLRALVKEADPEVVEEWKWRGVPVWYHDGLICTGETYKNVVKMTFAKGAALKDPSALFNSSLEGNTRRAIDFHEGEEIDEEALKRLVREAVTLNSAGS